MIRQGDCNWCGECCGTSGDSPFPKNWPEAIRSWSLDDANEVCPQLTMLGIAQQGDQIGYSDPAGSFKVGPTRFYYVWITGVGCCKDISAQHDGSAYLAECPFLLDDPGDGSRPCGLMGTSDDGAVKKFCRPELRAEPPTNYDIWIQESVDQWQADHPSCSYTWAEE